MPVDPGAALLTAVVGQIRDEIEKLKDNVMKFKSALKELDKTLIVVSPVITQIEEIKKKSKGSDLEIETDMLRVLLENGKELVLKCAKIPRWNIFKQGRYSEKLVKLDNEILKFLLYWQVHMVRVLKLTLKGIEEIKQMFMPPQKESSNPTTTASSSTGGSSTKFTLSMCFTTGFSHTRRG